MGKTNKVNEYDIAKNFLKNFQLRPQKLQEEYKFRDTDKQEDEEAFKSALNAPVQFGNLYVENNIAYFHGVLKFNEEGVIRWEFNTASTDGIYITCDKLELNEDIVSVINKLQMHYVEWRDKWVNNLNS